MCTFLVNQRGNEQRIKTPGKTHDDGKKSLLGTMKNNIDKLKKHNEMENTFETACSHIKYKWLSGYINLTNTNYISPVLRE